MRELVASAVTVHADGRTIEFVTRRSFLQARILAALGVDRSGWYHPRMTDAGSSGPM